MFMGKKEPLSGRDNAWRRMGTTENLMTITGILMFEEAIGYDEFCDRLEERLLRFDRFKQRVNGRKRRFRRPYWQTVEEFDIRNHVYQVSLPEPATEETFEEFVGRLMSRPLDERRPLWEAFVVDNAGDDGGNAVAVRINHSIGDGFALLYVMLGLVDNPEDIEFPIGGISVPPRPDLEEDEGAEDDSAEEPNELEKLIGSESDEDSGDESTTDGIETSSADENEVDEDGVDKMREEATPSGPLSMVAQGLKTTWKLLTERNEPNTSFYTGNLGQTKTAAWTDKMDLDKIKTVCKQHDATVNDVLLAATGGAIRRVLEERGEETEDLELRFTIPVNLKRMEDRNGKLGNHFGLVFAPIPVGTRDLNERIETIHERMDVQKAGVEAFIMYHLLNIGGYMPESVQNLVMKIFEKHATGIATNVPGPVDAVEFGGKKVSDLIFWVPQANDQGIGISIISYDGHVRVGVTGDAKLLPDPHVLTDAFHEEIAALEEQAAHHEHEQLAQAETKVERTPTDAVSQAETTVQPAEESESERTESETTEESESKTTEGEDSETADSESTETTDSVASESVEDGTDEEPDFVFGDESER